MKEDKLKKLLQSVEPDQPTADFTAMLMQKIEAQGAIVVNPALDALLEKHLMEAPSVDFTQKVMLGIERMDKKVVYEPIISKKMWYGIGIAAIIIIASVVYFSQTSQTVATPHPLTNPINQITRQIISQVSGLSTLVLACLFALSGLVLLDYFLSGKKNYQTEQ
jgi:hypothetical protein